ncbi:hypothetical protein Prudu_006294, partial [Prunus dulcis]
GTTKEVDEQKLKDLKAIDRSILETILEKDTSHQIWESMKKKYQGSRKVKRAQLQAIRRDFETLQMKNGESVNEYIGKAMSMANKMRIHDHKIKDNEVVEKIMRSMALKFDYVVYSIGESNDIENMSIDELQSSLLVHEQKLNRGGSQEQALKASTFTESSSSKEEEDVEGVDVVMEEEVEEIKMVDDDDPQGKGKEQFDKSQVECYRCGNYGYYKNECYTKLPKEKGEKSNFIEKKEEETLLMAFHVMENFDQETWYVDTGCSNHMSGCKPSFVNLGESYRTNVSFGDMSIVIVMGKEKIQIRTKNNFIETISNVFFIPDLKTNLLSAGQFQDKGYRITIFQGECEIYDPKRGSIAMVKMSPNRLFPLKLKSVNTCMVAKENDETWLWHHRFGHLHFNGLRTLYEKKMVTGLPKIIIQTKPIETFPSGKATRAHLVLELVHSTYVDQLMQVRMEAKCILSHLLMISVQKHVCISYMRSQRACDAFKSFKALVENEYEKKIKCLRTDRGGEFYSKEFEALCDENRIKRQLTVAYTPQQNEHMHTLPDERMKNYTTRVQNVCFLVLVMCPKLTDSDPITFEEASKKVKWKDAMESEIRSIEKNNTWELTSLTKGHKTIGVKWVFRTKVNEKQAQGSFGGKGYKQKYDIDYNQRSCMENYMRKCMSINHKVMKRKEKKKNRIDNHFGTLGFQKCPYDHSLYVKSEIGGKMLILCLYVDDLIYTGNNVEMMKEFKKYMMEEFEMTDLGLMSYFLELKSFKRLLGILFVRRNMHRKSLRS